MARGGMDTSWLWLVGIGAAVYFAQKYGVLPTPATPTPYSIYPEFAYTAQTSMAKTPAQKAPAAVITPTSDVPNLMIMAVPIIALYMLGVVVAYLFGKKRKSEEEA